LHPAKSPPAASWLPPTPSFTPLASPQGHPDKKEGWPELKTVADLKEILGTMIWIVSGHHSAINFSQYAYTGYILNRPNVCTKRIPKRGSEEMKVRVEGGGVWNA
jgi:lipoxygenase